MHTKKDKKIISLQERVENAVDVSGAFDNCFFHNFALYLLTNNLPLPDDLFHFKSIIDKDSKAEQLFQFFHNPESLNIFSLLDEENDFSEKPGYLFEKSLILGFLFREWFATQLVNNSKVKQEMLEGEKGVFNAFKNYKEYRSFMPKEELKTTEFGVLYEANEPFLEYFYNRTERISINRDSPFEKYFVDSSSDEEAIKNYWDAEGYKLYCQHLAKPQVKLSHIEIMTMMKVINQPLTIYDRSTSTVVAEYDNPKVNVPDFEVAIDALQGHYFLLKTEETEKELEEYERSYARYKRDRSEILSDSNKPVSSLLVRATCPKGHLDEDPFVALMERLSEIESRRPVKTNLTNKHPDSPNCNFLLKVGASVIGTSSAIITLLGIAILSGQYDPGNSLAEEVLATTVASSIVGLSYGLYNFFTSGSKDSTGKELEMNLDPTNGSSQKLKLN
ncbi:TPA: type IV secretion protein Dot [Legionella pneumophila]|nr:type IV secretion protein Dot [Legionella pneumophila]HAT3975734.1 type IV secretion protein Dot [Legionella pneumophila]HAT3977729.1 type IV secretion protein Dot [Legionella pneumophila]HAT8357623.1 type IV secretion protein Dot [Legionella pneumophila]HAT8358298.1 type IV secretion protein Dot [Legionella pneumophila]HAU1206786.1 type IV secretion protein Dot [Legionella pneumophila]